MSIKDIKTAIKNKKLIVGTKEVLKNLNKDNIVAVFYTTNCPDTMKKRINYYSQFSKAKIEEFAGNSQQLGEICGRPYKTVMVCVIK